jgi:D-3-phosphoglycerate dehydrogenase
MSCFVAMTDSPAGDDLSIERAVLSGMRVDRVHWRDAASLAEALGDCDAMLCMHAPVNRSVINSLRRCRAIVRYGTGLDNIDSGAAVSAGIPVVGVHNYCTEEVANHVFALLLAWNRRVPDYDRMVREKIWNQRPNTTGNWGYPLERLSCQTLGLLGLGHIGRAVAQRARAFGMPVLAHSRTLDSELARRYDVERVGVDELLRRSDYLSLHLPLNGDTRHLIGRDALARTKRGAVLINTARGGLVDETALVEALQSGHLGGALLDVYDKAPLPSDHLLRACSNVIFTPHVAFYSEGALAELRRRAAEEVKRHLTNEGNLVHADC